MNDVVEKWRQTGLLDNVSDERAKVIASTLDSVMADVEAGKKPYLAIEEEIIRLRKDGAFLTEKKVDDSG